MTTRKLVNVDGSLALVIDPGVLQILDIDENTDLKLSTDGDCLVMTPIRAKGRRRRFRAAMESALTEYESVLRTITDEHPRANP